MYGHRHRGGHKALPSSTDGIECAFKISWLTPILSFLDPLVSVFNKPIPIPD